MHKHRGRSCHLQGPLVAPFQDKRHKNDEKEEGEKRVNQCKKKLAAGRQSGQEKVCCRIKGYTHLPFPHTCPLLMHVLLWQLEGGQDMCAMRSARGLL
jgi:hypothetical protein